MKMLPAALFVVLLLTGCAASTIQVLEKKDTPKPFSNILAIYVDGDIDFSVFDSTTYNICIRPSLTDTAGFDTRNTTEDLLSDGLEAPRSVFYRSSAVFGPLSSSYDDFRKELDTLHIDAILLVHLHRYTYTKHDMPSAIYPLRQTGNLYVTAGVTGTYKTPNAAYACYLIRPNEFFPVWRAEIDVKGKGWANGKHALRTDMVEKLEKNLVTGGYIAPHLKTE